MTERIRVVASDFDGTILKNGAQEVDEIYFPLIRSLKARGISFIAASGRQYGNLRRLLAPVADEISFICENGALVAQGRRILSINEIERGLVDAMISDMERIGDQAADIAEISQYVTENNLLVKVHIAEMSEHAIKMVKDSVDSFVRKDIETVKNVISHDDIVDGLFLQVKSELTKVISETPEKATLCLDLLMIAKYLERIADHAVNIAEWVEYSITGVHVTDEVPRV